MLRARGMYTTPFQVINDCFICEALKTQAVKLKHSSCCGLHMYVRKMVIYSVYTVDDVFQNEGAGAGAAGCLVSGQRGS